MKKTLIIYIILTFLQKFIYNVHVCSEDELVKELQDDILDNGK